MLKAIPCLLLLIASAAPAFAQAAAEPAAPATPEFRSLWTGWDNANRDALRAEIEALERLRQDIATAGSERRRELLEEGRPLGELVGEIVRFGDCEEGERLARIAGDFALVEAVRGHCRPAVPAAETH